MRKDIQYPTEESERYDVSMEAVTNQSRNEQVAWGGSHEPQESVVPRNTANERGLRLGGVEPPSSRPPHVNHLLDECTLP